MIIIFHSIFTEIKNDDVAKLKRIMNEIWKSPKQLEKSKNSPKEKSTSWGMESKGGDIEIKNIECGTALLFIGRKWHKKLVWFQRSIENTVLGKNIKSIPRKNSEQRFAIPDKIFYTDITEVCNQFVFLGYKTLLKTVPVRAQEA